MEGEISIESEVGHGTRMRLELPLPMASAPQGPLLQESALPNVSGIRALVADDNATNRLILKAMLGALGVQAVLVEDGRRAVEAWAPGAFDVLMFDISMPELDGIGALSAVLRRCAAEGVTPPPAIAVTANAMKHQIEDYYAAGFASYVGKPFRREDLARVIARVRDGVSG